MVRAVCMERERESSPFQDIREQGEGLSWTHDKLPASLQGEREIVRESCPRRRRGRRGRRRYPIGTQQLFTITEFSSCAWNTFCLSLQPQAKCNSNVHFHVPPCQYVSGQETQTDILGPAYMHDNNHGFQSLVPNAINYDSNYIYSPEVSLKSQVLSPKTLLLDNNYYCPTCYS